MAIQETGRESTDDIPWAVFKSEEEKERLVMNSNPLKCYLCDASENLHMVADRDSNEKIVGWMLACTDHSRKEVPGLQGDYRFANKEYRCEVVGSREQVETAREDCNLEWLNHFVNFLDMEISQDDVQWPKEAIQAGIVAAMERHLDNSVWPYMEPILKMFGIEPREDEHVTKMLSIASRKASKLRDVIRPDTLNYAAKVIEDHVTQNKVAQTALSVRLHRKGLFWLRNRLRYAAGILEQEVDNE